MNLFQKLDNYLLHHFPNIWVTKVHVFLPIALIFMGIIYTFNVLLIGYNVKNPFPEAGWGVTLMVIPVLVFIVYWFVIQARYNVEKSGGKLSIPLEYMNFFLYFLMFVVSYILVSFIPFTNDLKIANTVEKIEISQDIKNLNIGNSIIYNNEVVRLSGNRYKIRYTNFVDSYYWKGDYEYTESIVEDLVENNPDKDEDYYKEKLVNYEDYKKKTIPKYVQNLYILATKNQVKEIVTNYINSYNKYTNNEIIASATTITENELKGNGQDFNLNYYQPFPNNDYRYNSWRNTVSYKIEYIARLKLRNNGAFEANYGDSEVSKIIFSWLLMLSLFVWIFKQIHWRDYLFGILALVLTPVLAGILGVFFGVFMEADEDLL